MYDSDQFKSDISPLIERRKSNIVSVILPKKQLENAVRAYQLYLGSSGCRMQDQQKLYDRLHLMIDRIAEKFGMDPNDVDRQILKEAEKRGKIIPTPAKDI